MSSTASEKLRILIADDDDAIRRDFRRAIAAHSRREETTELKSLAKDLFDEQSDKKSMPIIEQVLCRQGDQAVDAVAAATKVGRPFDIVILDIRMPPGINGLEAGRQIREVDPYVPIVVVTGFADLTEEQVIQSIPSPGQVFYMTKPLRLDDLIDKILQLGKDSEVREHARIN